MDMHGPFRDCQTQSYASAATRTVVLYTIERPEDILERRIRHSWTIVPHMHRYGLIIASDSDVYIRVIRRIADRVAHDIFNRAPQQLLVAPDFIRRPVIAVKP